MSKKSDADMYINNVEFSQCRTTHTHAQHTAQPTAQRHSTATQHSKHSTAQHSAQHSDTAQQHSTAPTAQRHSTATQHSTQHSTIAQRHSTAQHSTTTHSLLPFTSACLEFPFTLTCRALDGNHIVIVAPCRLSSRLSEHHKRTALWQ